MKKFAALLISLILVLTTAAFAEGTTVTMGIDPEFPPFTYIDDNGNYAGYDIELAQAVADILGWDLQIFAVDWDNKLIQLDAGECDLIWSGLTINDIDADNYTLSFAYIDNTQIVLVKADSGITTLADLAGKRVGAQAGTSAARLISEGGDRYEDFGATLEDISLSASYNVCITDLNGGAVDAIVIDQSIATSLIGDNAADYLILDETIASEQYGICFRKADTQLCAQLEEAFTQLVADGTYVALAEKYADQGVDVDALCLTAE